MARMTIVRTTVATQAQALALADALMQERLAACVHISQVHSKYRWQGRQEEADEWLVEARSLLRKARDVEARLLKGHPYELPLVESVKCNVNDAYAKWAKEG